MEMGREETEGMNFQCDMSTGNAISIMLSQGMNKTYSEMAHARPNPSYVEVPSDIVEHKVVFEQS